MRRADISTAPMRLNRTYPSAAAEVGTVSAGEASPPDAALDTVPPALFVARRALLNVGATVESWLQNGRRDAFEAFTTAETHEREIVRLIGVKELERPLADRFANIAEAAKTIRCRVELTKGAPFGWDLGPNSSMRSRTLSFEEAQARWKRGRSVECFCVLPPSQSRSVQNLLRPKDDQAVSDWLSGPAINRLCGEAIRQRSVCQNELASWEAHIRRRTRVVEGSGVVTGTPARFGEPIRAAALEEVLVLLSATSMKVDRAAEEQAYDISVPAQEALRDRVRSLIAEAKRLSTRAAEIVDLFADEPLSAFERTILVRANDLATLVLHDLGCMRKLLQKARLTPERPVIDTSHVIEVPAPEKDKA